MLRTKIEILNDIEERLNDLVNKMKADTEKNYQVNELLLSGFDKLNKKFLEPNKDLKQALKDLEQYENDPDLDGYYTDFSGVFGVMNVICQDYAFNSYENDDNTPSATIISDPCESEFCLENMRTSEVVRHVLKRAKLTNGDDLNKENYDKIKKAIKQMKTTDAFKDDAQKTVKADNPILSGGKIDEDRHELVIGKHAFDIDDLLKQASKSVYLPHNDYTKQQYKIRTVKVLDNAPDAGNDAYLVRFYCGYIYQPYNNSLVANSVDPITTFAKDTDKTGGYIANN